MQATLSGRGKRKYDSHLVRESFRTPEGPRSRTICNIAGLPPALRDVDKITDKQERKAVRVSDGSDWHLDLSEFTWM